MFTNQQAINFVSGFCMERCILRNREEIGFKNKGNPVGKRVTIDTIHV